MIKIAHPDLRAIIERLTAEQPDVVLRNHEEDSLFGNGDMTGAVFSDAEEYRYLLWRIWDPDHPVLIIVMLNPSTADEREDDRTIQTLKRRCSAARYGGFIVINLFAWRSPHPSEMKKAKDPVGPLNDQIIDIVLENENLDILCAWGPDGIYLNREEHVKWKLKKQGRKPLVLRISKNGQPEHPLYKRESDAWRVWDELYSSG